MLYNEFLFPAASLSLTSTHLQICGADGQAAEVGAGGGKDGVGYGRDGRFADAVGWFGAGYEIIVIYIKILGVSKFEKFYGFVARCGTIMKRQQ